MVLKIGDKALAAYADGVKLVIVAERQCDRIGMSDMKAVEPFEIEIGHNVAVDDDKRVFIEKIDGVFEGAASAENFRFITCFNGNGIGLSGKKQLYLFGQMVGVDHDRLAAGLFQVANHDIQQRATVYGKQRLGGMGAIGQEPGAETGCQYQCFHELSVL